MAGSSRKPKPSKARPAGTSQISHPAVEDASYLTALSAFSPSSQSFAYLSLAVDKHRLRVYSTDKTQGNILAEHSLRSARVTALNWGELDVWRSEAQQPPSKKKRKKAEKETKATSEVVILGLSDGTITIFSPSHGRILHTLSHPTSSSSILSVSLDDHDNITCTTTASNGYLHIWDVLQNTLRASWKLDQIPYTAHSIRPGSSNQLLAAHHSIRLLELDEDNYSNNPETLVSFTGHASPVKILRWDASQTPPTRAISLAEADRVLSVWELSKEASDEPEGRIAASIQLDSDARSASFSSLSASPTQTLLTLSASGRISLFPLPAKLSNSSQSLPTILPRTVISQKSTIQPTANIVAASFMPTEPNQIRVARLSAGVRPVFNIVTYLDSDGEFVPELTLDEVDPSLLVKESNSGIANKRYTESNSTSVGAFEQGQDEDMDDTVERDIQGDLDVDIAELSLGQRLAAQQPSKIVDASDSDSDPTSSKRRNTKASDTTMLVPASSLTRTLIQALHSSDSKLLETCLAHSDSTLIQNTIRRLPPQLAVPLITACVERLGQGARASNMKGGGAGASSQRGSGLIEWVKATLIVHNSHLMTMPDLIARLSGLHATLTARLALQDSLLALNGRLDMVLSQIEMRSSIAPAPITAPKQQKNGKSQRVNGVKRYVEGESEDEDEQMEVDVESGDDAGSVEDVQLGAASSDDDGSDVASGREDDDDDSGSEGGPVLNGFIDDEADESYDEDEDEDLSE